MKKAYFSVNIWTIAKLNCPQKNAARKKGAQLPISDFLIMGKKSEQKWRSWKAVAFAYWICKFVAFSLRSPSQILNPIKSMILIIGDSSIIPAIIHYLVNCIQSNSSSLPLMIVYRIIQIDLGLSLVASFCWIFLPGLVLNSVTFSVPFSEGSDTWNFKMFLCVLTRSLKRVRNSLPESLII